MNYEFSTTALDKWQHQAYQYLLTGDYSQTIKLYEQAIAANPEVKSYCWYLGLVFLLQGQEAEAQTTWLLGMLEGEPSQVELWNAELIEVLQQEALRREALEEYAVAWAIRQQIKEICPTHINNLLHLIELAIQLKTYTGDELVDLGVIERLQPEQGVKVDWELLIQVLRSVLNCSILHPLSLKLVEACLAYTHNDAQKLTVINILLPAAIDIGYFRKQPAIAARFIELGLRLDEKNPELLNHLSCFYQNSTQYEQGIETAKFYYSLLDKLPDKINANKQLLRGLMSAGGHWEEACSVFKRQESLLLSLIEENPIELDQLRVLRLINANYFAPYFRDKPRSNRKSQNQVAQIFQANTQIYAKEQVEKYRQNHQARKPPNAATQKRLKIGYLSHCLKSHSVGWLARWAFHYHDRDRFQINAYMITSPHSYDPLQEWYVSQVDQAYKLGKSFDIAKQIDQDEIDILIDLDSITLDFSCEVLALKPAPVQVTWLGWDASGIPAVDYFIADPYVLPESAQKYYAEKIWRLPQTYIAVDGFEVGVPTRRRADLDIPSDAIVYLSGQKGYKRHPDTARLQMKIIKEVPNSYFLIKGWADDESIKNFFTQIAESEGVDSSRLRFLPPDSSEAIHRANLGIADLALDTYPYNGATTTLEILWMCIPLVTRVGEQFAARNSYTMMMNAGVTEGIAWTDEEYIEWGVRLGKDEALRQKVASKLKASRQTAPLWNGKQFTSELEKAYEQMWVRYIESHQ